MEWEGRAQETLGKLLSLSVPYFPYLYRVGWKARLHRAIANVMAEKASFGGPVGVLVVQRGALLPLPETMEAPSVPLPPVSPLHAGLSTRLHPSELFFRMA